MRKTGHGAFLPPQHTQDLYTTAFDQPFSRDWWSYEAWEAGSAVGPDARARASPVQADHQRFPTRHRWTRRSGKANWRPSWPGASRRAARPPISERNYAAYCFFRHALSWSGVSNAPEFDSLRLNGVRAAVHTVRGGYWPRRVRERPTPPPKPNRRTCGSASQATCPGTSLQRSFSKQSFALLN